jgi:hypothetical protein
MTWQGKVVDRLCLLKASGFYTFDEAWLDTMRRYPKPGWATRQTTSETVAQFFKRACDDAWHNRRPGLKHFASTMLDGIDEYDYVNPRRRVRVT